jgi:hypothetical protein
MATASELRTVILLSADGAMADEPSNLELRARMFLARLCGSISSLRDDELEDAVRMVLGQIACPFDGA